MKSWSLAKRPAPSLQPCWAWLSLTVAATQLSRCTPFPETPDLGGLVPHFTIKSVTFYTCTDVGGESVS